MTQVQIEKRMKQIESHIGIIPKKQALKMLRYVKSI